LSLLDGIHLLVKAWNLVSGGTIKNCYRKAGWAAIGQDIHHPNEPLPLYEELFQQISTSISFHEFITVDDGVVSRATLSDVEIIASVKGSEVSEDEFQEDSDVEKVQDTMVIQNADEAYRMVNALRLFLASHLNSDEQNTTAFVEIERMVDKVLQKKRTRQPLITEFF